MDNQYSSFYLYRKYEVIGDELIDLGITSIDADGTQEPVMKEECDPECGCIPPPEPQYRWVVVPGGYECSGTTKMTQEKEQVSLDSGVTWNDVSPLTTRAALPVIEYDSEDCGYIPPLVCDCSAFVFSGTSEGNNVYRIEIQSGETAVTAASWNTSCGLTPQDFVHTDDAGFQAIVTDGHWTFDNNMIKFTASTNPTSSVREGYMTITYTVDGVSCTKVTHLVQAAGQGFNGRYKLTLNNSNTVTAACNSTSSITSGEVATQYSGTVMIVTAEIGNCVTSIGNFAFGYCSGLTSVTIGNAVTSIGDRAFRYCSGLTSVNIPDSVTGIGPEAFRGCTSLTSVTIGNGVTAIDSGAFRQCSGLTSITVNATTPPWLGTNGPFDNTNNCPIYVPSGSVDTYKTANRWSSLASRIQAIP